MKFPFDLDLKLIISRCPKIWVYYSLIIICTNIGTPKTINFPFGTNGKLMVLGVPLLMHFRVTDGTDEILDGFGGSQYTMVAISYQFTSFI